MSEKKIKEFIQNLSILKDEAIELELYETKQMLDETLSLAIWEAVDNLEYKGRHIK